MNVRLIAITQGVEEARTPEEIISYCARVSNPNNQSNFDTSEKLIGYLIKHKHWSPFEQVFLTVEIETSRAIAAQILRHRSFTFQELSQRYSQVDEYISYEARRQDNKNRQNSIDDMDERTKQWFNTAQEHIWHESFMLYKKAIEKGIAKEQSRFLLPLNTKTRMYMSGPLRSFLHYVDLRKSNGTQKEHRDIALGIKDILSHHFPATCKAMWEETN